VVHLRLVPLPVHRGDAFQVLLVRQQLAKAGVGLVKSSARQLCGSFYGLTVAWRYREFDEAGSSNAHHSRWSTPIVR
jgi:hypothetical protein